MDATDDESNQEVGYLQEENHSSGISTGWIDHLMIHLRVRIGAAQNFLEFM